jgi:hypothetical protein
MADFQITQVGVELQDILDNSVASDTRNILYNTGHSAIYFPVNQTGFDGNWASLAIGEAGWDGWVKQSSTHKAQIIELGNFENINYYLSYDGNILPVITPPDGVSTPWLVSVPFAVDKLDLRSVKINGAWHPEDMRQKRDKCHRVYYSLQGDAYAHPVNNNTALRATNIPLPSMRVAPDIAGLTSTVGTIALVSSDAMMARVSVSGVSLVDVVSITGLEADASLAIIDAGTNVTIVGV